MLHQVTEYVWAIVTSITKWSAQFKLRAGFARWSHNGVIQHWLRCFASACSLMLFCVPQAISLCWYGKHDSVIHCKSQVLHSHSKLETLLLFWLSAQTELWDDASWLLNKLAWAHTAETHKTTYTLLALDLTHLRGTWSYYKSIRYSLNSS